MKLQLVKRNGEMLKHLENIREILMNSNATPIRCRIGIGYACCFCNSQYPEPEKLKTHTIDEHGDVKCEYMKDQSISNFMVKMDISNLHCTLCKESIDNLEILLDHLEKLHGKSIHRDKINYIVPFRFSSDVFKCVICNRESNNFKVLLEHMNLHYRNFICEICDAGFVNKRTLQVHSLRHRTGEFNCPQCSKTFDTKVKMRDHERAVHVFLNKRNKCSYCGERFSDYTKKNDHEVREHGVKAQVLKCQACEKIFDNQRALSVHTKTYHLMEKRMTK